MGKSSPAPVDFKGAALAEGEASKDLAEAQTWANRPNQVNPWGSVNWQATPVYDPVSGQNINSWTQTQTLSPALNEALTYQMGLASGRSQLGYGMLGNVAQELGRPLDWSAFGGMQMPGQQQYQTDQGQPELVGSIAGALPGYQTTGSVRQLNYGDAPGIMAPQFGVQRAEDAIWNRQQSRIQPQQESELQSLEIKLRNQGLSPGDQAYQSAMQSMGQKHNDQTQMAMNEAIMGGGREAERLLGMETGYRGTYTGEMKDLGNFYNQASQQDFDQQMRAGSQSYQDLLAAANFQNQARSQGMMQNQQMGAYNQNLDFRMADYYNQIRQQAINEEMTRRGQSLNETNALIAGQQVGLPQFNSFMGANAGQAPQLLNAAAHQGQMNAAIASAENAGMQGMMGAVGSALGAYGMYAGLAASDRRLKSNIRKIGERNGVNWYSYEIFGKPAIGVMADEVPHAAVRDESGYWMVDYSKV